MFEEFSENRPGRASAVWVVQINRSPRHRAGWVASVRRASDARRRTGNDAPSFSNADSSSKRAAHRWRRPITRLATSVRRLGDKLARWRLAPFTGYPWNRGD
jgi:hypothetical protein